ncbi:hypothetical protein OQA88_7288 [Cercophora sp. LCS_1]
MKQPTRVVLIPLSGFIIYTSLIQFRSPLATWPTRLLSLFVILITTKYTHSLVTNLLFHHRAHRQGCGDVPLRHHRDPLLGLDYTRAALRALNTFKLMPLYVDGFDKYGQTHYYIALGQRILITNDAANIKAILTNLDAFPIAGPRLLTALPVLGPNSIFTSNGQTWHDARAMIRPSFVRDQVSDLQHFERHVSNLLGAVPRDGTTFDMQDLLMKMTMDSSTDFMLGYSTNSLVEASPAAARFLADFEYASAECAKKARLGPILFKLPHRGLEEAVVRLRGFIRGYLEQVRTHKVENVSEQEDRSYVFLDELLKLGIPEDHVVDHILSIIIAGRDTTAASMAAVFYCLARAPGAVARLRAEIEEEGTETPSWEQLRGMKFLNNVIKEALRLFPPIATNARSASRETVLPTGGGPDGKQPILVPKGMPVRWSLYCLQRRKDIYGPDADEFKPERWEKKDLKHAVAWEYIPFHGGPRICLGQQFALTQMGYALFRFFKTFKSIEAREEGEPLIRTSISASFAHGCLISVAE